MTKQLGLKQVLRYGCAVQGHKVFVGPRAKIMQAAGNQLFATAGFTAYQHVYRQGCQISDLSAQGLQAARNAEQPPLYLFAPVGLLVQTAVFQHQLALFQRASQGA